MELREDMEQKAGMVKAFGWVWTMGLVGEEEMGLDRLEVVEQLLLSVDWDQTVSLVCLNYPFRQLSCIISVSKDMGGCQQVSSI